MPYSNILHPARYHGFKARPPFFEGWYFKLTNKNQNHRFAIIPGIYLAEERSKSHCFVQVFDSQSAQVAYHRYPLESFMAAKETFEIKVGPNVFTSNQISLAIDDELGEVEGQLNFNGLNSWPTSFISPGAMGWFAWVPFMECYHDVISMDHAIQGVLAIDGQIIDFSRGRGYIEKDWGKQFPSAWIWGQSNHFNRPGIGLMLSVAVIPWLGGDFAGFIIGFLYQGKIYRFATYNHSHIESLSIDNQEITLTVKNARYRLEIHAIRAEGGLLQAPTTVDMDRRIIETLDARIKIRFANRNGEMLYEGWGENAGLEAVGNLNKLPEKIR